MKIAKVIKKNKLLAGVFLVYLFLFVAMPDKGAQSLKNSMYYVKEMLEIIPVIFLLTSLIEAWVPREVIMNSFGEKSGMRGSILSFILGSFSAGPIYAAFPVCKMLIKKGASIFNIVIILSTWAVVKVPMLVNEAKFLGVKFMVIRWILTTISIFIMAYLVFMVIKKEDIPVNEQVLNKKNENTIKLKTQYCIGCGLCTKICSECFIMVDGKAEIKNEKIKPEFMENLKEAMEKCPAKAIYF